MSENNKLLSIQGKAIAVRGDDIDTDRIIPARYMKCLTFDGIEQYVFYDQRFDGNEKTNHIFNHEKYSEANILLVNKNFGCGSSREHAPQAIHRWGIEAIVGESFAPIFYGNCITMGVPAVMVEKDIMEQLMNLIENHPETLLKIDIENKKIKYNNQAIDLFIRPVFQKLLVSGEWNITSSLMQNKDRIMEIYKKLPYTNNFL